MKQFGAGEDRSAVAPLAIVAFDAFQINPNG
jgi:hypothetical protein